jgi:hypothetical protein
VIVCNTAGCGEGHTPPCLLPSIAVAP